MVRPGARFYFDGVFFFGALSVFDREIDRWAIPETRFDPQPMPSFDQLLAPVFAQLQPDKDDMVATQKRVLGDLPPYSACACMHLAFLIVIRARV